MMRDFCVMRTLLTAMVVIGFAAAANAQSASLSKPGSSASSSSRPDSFHELADRLMPAVVNISTQQVIANSDLPGFPDGSPMERFNEFFGRNPEGLKRQGALGSGFVVSADGFIITNNHVIEGADEITVAFSDGDELDAELIGRDPDTDLAVLKVNSPTSLPFVDLGDSDTAEVGDWVIAIGNPFGLGGSVSAGIVSARNREIGAGRTDDFIQTDAAINRGNSGGPLFNLDGEVVGVNTAIYSPTGGSVGIGFSVPSNLVKDISRRLRSDGQVRRGWLGVNIQEADKELVRAAGADAEGGVIISRITKDGPAEKAGLQVGDVLLKFDGAPVESTRDLTKQVALTDVGKTVELELLREGSRRTISVELGELDLESSEEKSETPDIPEGPEASNDIGAEISGIDEEARRRFGIPKDVDGVLVRSVQVRGPAFGKLERGDVIVAIDYETVGTVERTLEILKEKQEAGDKLLLLQVKRTSNGAWFDQFFAINLE